MLLYHGTSAKHLNKIMQKGLTPRGKRKGNWNHTIDSHAGAVYMTSAYAGYFAFTATQSVNYKWLIIEIDTDRLEEHLLHPDEDVLAQANYRHYPDMNLLQVTEYYRDNIADYQDMWEASVEAMGTCAYHGTIPPEAFTRVAVFDPQQNPEIVGIAADPSISIINYRFMSSRYKHLTRYLLGEKVRPEEIFNMVNPELMVGDNNDAMNVFKQMIERQAHILDIQPVTLIKCERSKHKDLAK